MFDEDKADNSALDVTMANVKDDAAVGDNSEDDDDDDYCALKCLRDKENFASSFNFTFLKTDISHSYCFLDYLYLSHWIKIANCKENYENWETCVA